MYVCGLVDKQMRMGNNQEVKGGGRGAAAGVAGRGARHEARQGVAASPSERAFFPTPEYQCHIIMCDLDSYCAIYIYRPPPLTSYFVLKSPITFPHELFNSKIRFQIFNVFSQLDLSLKFYFLNRVFVNSSYANNCVQVRKYGVNVLLRATPQHSLPLLTYNFLFSLRGQEQIDILNKIILINQW